MKSLLPLLMCLLSAFYSWSQDQDSIVYDGSDIQEFINNLPENSIAIFSPDTMVYEESLIIQNKRNIVFNFNGFTVKSVTDGKNSRPTLAAYHRKWPRNRSHLVLNGGENIEIIGLNIIGPHSKGGAESAAYVPSLEAQHGIEIFNSNGLILKDLNISRIYGDGIYITHNSSDIEITNSSITHNGRQGIAIVEGQDIVIRECYIGDIRRSHIDLEPNNDKQIVKNVKIINNRFGRRRLNWIAAGSSKGRVQNIHVEGNVMNGAGNIWIGNKTNKFRPGPFVFLNNTSKGIYGTKNGGIWRLIQVDGFKAEGNNIKGQKYRNMSLIYATRCTNIDLGKNEVPFGKNEIKTVYIPKEKSQE